MWCACECECARVGGASHVCALKFKESAGDGGGYLFEYVRRILNERAIYESLVSDLWTPRYITKTEGYAAAAAARVC